MKERTWTQYVLFFAVPLVVALSLSVAASPVGQLTPSGDGIELIFRSDGSTLREVIPLHRAGLIRYFSAGVGVEERQARYPGFLLKIIFIAGDGAYVTHTPVTISEIETVWLEVPAEHVTGPWLFVAIPPGTYAIRATRDGLTQLKENVKVTPRSPTTVYFRWP